MRSVFFEICPWFCCWLSDFLCFLHLNNVWIHVSSADFVWRNVERYGKPHKLLFNNPCYNRMRASISMLVCTWLSLICCLVDCCVSYFVWSCLVFQLQNNDRILCFGLIHKFEGLPKNFTLLIYSTLKIQCHVQYRAALCQMIGAICPLNGKTDLITPVYSTKKYTYVSITLRAFECSILW